MTPFLYPLPDSTNPDAHTGAYIARMDGRDYMVRQDHTGKWLVLRGKYLIVATHIDEACARADADRLNAV